MSRSPSRSPAIQDAWTTCVALCARAWQRPQCATRVPSRAKWKLRFAPCGSIGVQPRLGMSKYQLDRIKLNAIELKLSDAVTLAVPESLQSITAYVLLEQEAWFEKEMDFLRHWLRSGMTVIDIGANIGVYSLPISRLVGRTGCVFAYEPGTEARSFLQRSRKLNKADNLEIIPL